MRIEGTIRAIEKATLMGFLNWEPTGEVVRGFKGYSCKDTEGNYALAILPMEVKDEIVFTLCIKSQSGTITLTSNQEIIHGYKITRAKHGKSEDISSSFIRGLISLIEEVIKFKQDPSEIRNEFINQMNYIVKKPETEKMMHGDVVS